MIYVTQSPSDLPHIIASQLATRIQHALRASTLHHHKALKAAAETMPGNVSAASIPGLATGQAIVSVPSGDGAPLPGRGVAIQSGTLRLHRVGLPPTSAPRLDASASPPTPKPPRARPWWYWPAILAAVLWELVAIGYVK